MWRNQNPLPYHLATPHRESIVKLSGKFLSRNKAAGGTPPERFGSKEYLTGTFGLITIAEQGEASRAAAAHAREQSAGKCGEAGEHGGNLRYESDRGVGQIIAPPHKDLAKPSRVGRHLLEPP